MAVRKANQAGADLLASLANSVPAAAPPKGGKAKWELELTAASKKHAIAWIESKVVGDAFDAKEENEKVEFIEYALRKLAEKILTNKAQPSNPLVVIKGSKGEVLHQFQVTMQDKFKIRLPDIPEGQSAVDFIASQFESVGLTKEKARELVEEELDMQPVTGMTSLNVLLDGDYGEKREWVEATDQQKSAGQKLVKFLMWDGTGDAPEALTIEEKTLILKRSTGIKVKAGFYNRICNYASTVDQIMGIFKMIQPVIFPCYPKYGMSLTETERTNSKIAAAAAVLGTVAEDQE